MIKEFQSTHSQGVRQQSTVKGAFFVGISIHALTRSATYSTMFASCSGSSFQSTHSQGVRPPTSPPIPAPYFISIHALTRSATWSGAPLASTWVISIHALTRSATDRLFQYRSCMHISIHALTRSATIKENRIHSTNLYFNPRTHKECDPLWLLAAFMMQAFQSTHSQGVRLFAKPMLMLI